MSAINNLLGYTGYAGMDDDYDNTPPAMDMTPNSVGSGTGGGTNIALAVLVGIAVVVLIGMKKGGVKAVIAVSG